jgi:hypothetical protein
MTLYTNLDSLCAGLSDADLNNPAQVVAFQGLIKTYFTALHNPPLGVIGVGAITYAENMLVAYQTGK